MSLPVSTHVQYLAPTIAVVLPRMASSLELLGQRSPSRVATRTRPTSGPTRVQPGSVVQKALMQMSFRLDHINFRLDRTNTQLSELPCYSLCP